MIKWFQDNFGYKLNVDKYSSWFVTYLLYIKSIYQLTSLKNKSLLRSTWYAKTLPTVPTTSISFSSFGIAFPANKVVIFWLIFK